MSFWDYLLIVDDGRESAHEERPVVEDTDVFSAGNLDNRRGEFAETLPVEPGPVDGGDSSPVPAQELLRRLAAGEYDT